jgi:hypothetical protein
LINFEERSLIDQNLLQKYLFEVNKISFTLKLLVNLKSKAIKRSGRYKIIQKRRKTNSKIKKIKWKHFLLFGKNFIIRKA